MSTSRTVAVAGATGNQGGVVARELLARGIAVRALTRRVDSPAARTLAALGATLVAADLTDRASLFEALRGVSGFFAMTTPYEHGVDAEVEQGTTLVAAARAASVPHVVFSSVASADRATGIPHFESKARVEEELRASGLSWTILGPVFFMENFLSPWWLPALQEGVLPMALPANRSLQQIAVKDVGRFAALALEQPERFAGRRIDLASHELTGEAVARAISKASGRGIRYVELPLEEVRAKDKDFALMFGWFDQVGYTADIAGLREEHPGVNWHTFEEWASEQDWADVRAGA